MNGFFSESMRRDPFPIYAQMRAASPVMHVAQANLWVVLDHADVKWVLNDHATFTSNVSPARNVDFQWLMFMDPPDHTTLRAVISKAFTPRSIAELEPRIRAMSRGLLAHLGDECDLVGDYATPLPMMVMAELLGVDPDQWPTMARWSEAIIGLASTIFGDAEAAARASARFYAAEAEMVAAIDAWVRRPAGLMARLVEAGLEGKPLVRFVQLLLAAGTETTTNLISNAVLSLTAHRDQLVRLRAEPALIPQALEEVLRYRSPAQAMFRVAKSDVTIGGHAVPAGAFILALIGAANHDPKVFAAPERFDITRDPNPHIAFGHGIHHCLGAPLSRLEGKVALADLLRQHDLRLVHHEPWQPREAFHVHGPTRLPIRFS